MNLLRGALRTYAWGSRTAIAEFTGRPSPTAHPEAELWFGAHPGDPAWLETDNGDESLLEAVRSDPEGQLGAAVCKRFGDALPFLMKVLAADEPLSLQAHPSARTGRRGFRARRPARHSGVVADPQLPRPQPQTGTAGGAGHLRSACGFPACAEIGGIDAGACGFRSRSVRQPAGGPAGRRRPSRAFHHMDHRAPTGSRRAGARRDRRRDQLCPVGREAVRGGGEDGARARGAVPRRRRSAGLAAVEPVDAAARRGDLSARGQPAHLPARRRDRGDGQLRQRASRWPDPETR